MTTRDWITSFIAILVIVGSSYAWIDTHYVKAGEFEQLNISVVEGRLAEVNERIFVYEQKLKQNPGDIDLQMYLQQLHSDRENLRRQIEALYQK